MRNQIPVEVNLLADEYAITGKQYRIQNVQDMQPRKVRGVDFETSENFTIRRMLLGGGEDTVEVQVASIRSFLVMRRVAIKVRLKEKVAWNIYFCIRYYPDGVDLLIQDLQLLFRQGLV